jgi:AcrR family transcriptional regulator
MDRRVRRTRADITDAFVGLVIERGYDRVTVQDILDRADVGRSTFYAHFRDKEALLFSCFDDVREELAAALANRPPESPLPASAVFEHAYRHRQVYRAMCGRPGGTIVQRHLHTMIASALLTYLAPAKGTGVPVDAAAEFYASALLGLLIWWVGQDFPTSPKQIAKVYGQLALV